MLLFPLNKIFLKKILQLWHIWLHTCCGKLDHRHRKPGSAPPQYSYTVLLCMGNRSILLPCNQLSGRCNVTFCIINSTLDIQILVYSFAAFCSHTRVRIKMTIDTANRFPNPGFTGITFFLL